MFLIAMLDLIFSAVLCLLFVTDVCCDYWSQRSRFIAEERDMYLGSQLKLDSNETLVNKMLMEMKTEEYLAAFNSINLTFPPARHFFGAKSDIDKSNVFKFIEKMPKGALLHGHVTALGSIEFMIKNLTYRDHLYACVDKKNNFRFHFFLKPDGKCNWTLVSEMRSKATDVDTFDNWLKQKMSLVVSNPLEKYPDINSIWSAFEKIFDVYGGLLAYRPVYEDYLYHVLTLFYEDNVMYMELRTGIRAGNMHDLSEKSYSTIEIAKVMQKVINTFTEDHPDFLGCTLIHSNYRKKDNETINFYLREFMSLRRVLPDFVVGFDLIGQEDLGEPLISFIDALLELRDEGAVFFFHAGETNWEGTTDLNIIDAILLDTTRIGHGYASTKHPLAMKLIKEKEIALEVSPISNQVLLLVKDLRNHPASSLMADNYPIVITCDDPILWDAKGLSYDMYAAFMGLGGLHADLRTLKQLALNSLKYSALGSERKKNAILKWQKQWSQFIGRMIREESGKP